MLENPGISEYYDTLMYHSENFRSFRRAKADIIRRSFSEGGQSAGKT